MAVVMEEEQIGVAPTEQEAEVVDSPSESQSEFEKKFEDQKKRAEKAEAEARELRAKLETRVINDPVKPVDISKEEVKLYAQGLDDEAIETLKIYSKQLKVSLTEAKDSDVYKAWETAREQKRKSQEASLGASSSSGSSSKKIDFTTSGLTKEQHKELWKKSVGR